jgi:hypothetical protein
MLTPSHGYHETAEEQARWRPVIFCPTVSDEARRMAELLGSGKVRTVYDTILGQLGDLVKARAHDDDLSPEAQARGVQEYLAGALPDTVGRWAYYPWSGRLVHVLPPAEFRELRLDRNRHKITARSRIAWPAAPSGLWVCRSAMRWR